MVDHSRRKAEVHRKQQELQGLLNEWDPLAVMPGQLAPSDEYDCLIGLLGRLQRGGTPDKLAYLRRRLRHHFGIDPDESHPDQFADQVFAWYWADPLPGSRSPSGR
jgi:hypothetical protein